MPSFKYDFTENIVNKQLSVHLQAEKSKTETSLMVSKQGNKLIAPANASLAG